jgi:hypothetical protein
MRRIVLLFISPSASLSWSSLKAWDAASSHHQSRLAQPNDNYASSIAIKADSYAGRIIIEQKENFMKQVVGAPELRSLSASRGWQLSTQQTHLGS